MKNLLIFSILIAFNGAIKAQDLGKIRDEIMAEGTLLYKLEMAAWNGTDIVLEKFKDNQGALKGYFAYSENAKTHLIFYNKKNKIIANIGFDSTFSEKNAVKDYAERDMTTLEKRLFVIRSKAVFQLANDSLYQSYKNTNFNTIPVVGEKESKVYVLTGPENSGVIIIGNDYVMNFNEKDSLISQKKIHRSMIPIEYGEKDKEVAATMHTHLPETGDFITATDVCTLMLYGKYAKWQNHYVISKNYYSMWDFSKNGLVILTKEVFEKITKDTEKEAKKKKKKDKK
jgi:hypothetical protein